MCKRLGVNVKKEQWQIDFYRRKAWRKIRKEALDRDKCLCQRCLKSRIITVADCVHHIKPLRDHPELGLALSNLIALCNTCHEQVEQRYVSDENKKTDARINGVRIVKM